MAARRGEAKGGQQAFRFRTHGGWRPKAGRKRTSRKVPHRRREFVSPHWPVHVTQRFLPGVSSLRRGKRFQVIRRALATSCDKSSFSVAQWSVQGNHMHLICEAKTARALARGMQGLKGRLTKGLNALFGERKGTVFADRYHERVLKTPTEVRNGLAYFLLNARRHGEHLNQPPGPRGIWIDPYSSAFYFDGWQGWRDGRLGRPPPGKAPVAAPRSWLLRIGWRDRGLIGPTEVPGRA